MSDHLLVIECEEEENTQGLYKELSNIIEKQPSKKIVLITKQNDALANHFKMHPQYIEKVNEIKFSDLIEDSQNKLLEEKIVFQGKEIQLCQLIDKNLQKHIDAEVLSKLISKETIEIGKNLESLGDVEDYYIGRTFKHRRRIKEACFKAKDVPDLFAISGTSESELSQLIDQRLIRRFEDKHPNKSQARFILLNDAHAANAFKELSHKYSQGRPLHWLKKEGDKFVWQQSQGAVSTLRQFVDEDSVDNYRLEKITDIPDKVVLIVAEPGMGKSTVLTRLAEQEKELGDASVWIARVDLVNHIEQLSNGSSFDDLDKTIAFLTKALDLEKAVEKGLLQHRIKRQGKIIILFDGFDEISPQYKTKVIQLLQVLKDTKVEKVWITTRPHMQRELEDKLGTLYYTLKPFSEDDQREFLKKFWGRNLNLSDKIKLDRLEIYTNRLLDLVTQSIHDREREFTGIPLQTRMLAQAFQENFRRFHSSAENNTNLPKKLNLLELYQRFIESKYKIYYEEKMQTDIKNPAVAALYEKSFKADMQEHQQLAVVLLFPGQAEDLLQNRRTQNELPYNEELARIGIIQIVDGNPRFIHRTFAEYFVANLFVSMLADDPKRVRVFLLEEIFKIDNEVIRIFLDRKLAGRNSIHIAVLNEDKQAIRDLLLKGDNSLDNEGRTALHLAAAYGYEEVTELLSNKKENLGISDNIFNWTPLKYSVKAGKWNTAELLLQKGANPCDIEVTNLRATDYQGQTALHVAAENNYRNVANALLDSLKGNLGDLKEFIFIKIDVRGMAPLDCASHNGHNEIVRAFLKDSAELSLDERRDLILKGREAGRVYTALHYAAQENHKEILQDLLKFYDPYGKPWDGWTLLHVAAHFGQFEIVEILLENYPDHVNDKDDTGHTPLHEAAYAECLNEPSSNPGSHPPSKDYNRIVASLIKKGAEVDARNKDGMTPLHSAAYQGNLDIIKILIENGADIDAVDPDIGITPLFYAVLYCRFEVVQFLIEKKAKVTFERMSNLTALHVAAILPGNVEGLKIIEYLLEKGIDVNTEISFDKDFFKGLIKKFTSLAHFEQHSISRYVKYLRNPVSWGLSRVTITPLKISKGMDNKEVTEFLLERGAEIHHKSILDRPFFFLLKKLHSGLNKHVWQAKKDDNLTLLYQEVRRSDLKKVQSLLEQGANVLAASNNRDTVLHQAVLSNNPKMVELILKEIKKEIKEEFDNDQQTWLQAINEKDHKGNTPLMCAAAYGKAEAAQILLTSGVEINSKNDQGMTALHWAIQEHYLEVLSTLLDKGANVNIASDQGLTPLELAKSIQLSLSGDETKVQRWHTLVERMEGLSGDPFEYQAISHSASASA